MRTQDEIVARYNERKGDDFLTVDGVFTRVTDRELTFRGTIVARVAENVGGVACKRGGTLHFRRSGKRKFFRLVEMRNPCQPDGEMLVDYVDIFVD